MKVGRGRGSYPPGLLPPDLQPLAYALLCAGTWRLAARSWLRKKLLALKKGIDNKQEPCYNKPTARRNTTRDKLMPKYYATRLTQGFRSTADVLVFGTKRARDAYVAQHDGLENSHGNRTSCRALPKREITSILCFCDDYRNRIYAPRPFSGEAWVIDPCIFLADYFGCQDDPHYLGCVCIGYPADRNYARLF